MVEEAQNTSGPLAGTRPGAPRRRGRLRRFLRLGGLVFVLVLALFVGGFLYFANMVGSMLPPEGIKADGIVVLTGGSQRLKLALDLLGKGMGQRLLISGVHQSTTPQQLRRLTRSSSAMFNCCVDMGYEALDTIAVRRPVLEACLARLVDDEPGVTVRRGARLTGVVLRDGAVPRACGVRLGDEVIAADVVVEYTSGAAPLDDFSPDALDALASKLAAELCLNLKDATGRAQEMIQRYQVALSAAKQNDVPKTERRFMNGFEYSDIRNSCGYR